MAPSSVFKRSASSLIYLISVISSTMKPLLSMNIPFARTPLHWYPAELTSCPNTLTARTLLISRISCRVAFDLLAPTFITSSRHLGSFPACHWSIWRTVLPSHLVHGAMSSLHLGSMSLLVLVLVIDNGLSLTSEILTIGHISSWARTHGRL